MRKHLIALTAFGSVVEPLAGLIGLAVLIAICTVRYATEWVGH
jgi:hypothetical protein